MGKRVLKTIIPWAITLFALYIVFKDIDWKRFQSHLSSAEPLPIGAAILLTCLSYLFRARRWQDLFPTKVISYFKSLQVLILGFFMNNVLPARAGELVRTHLGAKVTGESRALVLATIASERLTDGLTLSIFFVIFSFGLGDKAYSEKLFYVALAFAAVALGVLTLLIARSYVYEFAEKVSEKVNRKSISYLTFKSKTFIEGLSPLCHWPGAITIALWSIVIWMIELLVFVSVTNAYGEVFSLSLCCLFMVAVNFSSLIPASPGGIGVIEAATTAILVSVGVEREHALTMVLTQHVIQYLVIGIPGAISLVTWKGQIHEPERSAA